MDIRSIRNRTIITTSIMTKIVSKITNHGGGGGEDTFAKILNPGQTDTKEFVRRNFGILSLSVPGNH